MGRGRIRWGRGGGGAGEYWKSQLERGIWGEVEIYCNGNSLESTIVSLAISPSSRR